MIGTVVMRDLVSQPLQFGAGFGFGEGARPVSCRSRLLLIRARDAVSDNCAAK